MYDPRWHDPPQRSCWWCGALWFGVRTLPTQAFYGSRGVSDIPYKSIASFIGFGGKKKNNHWADESLMYCNSVHTLKTTTTKCLPETKRCRSWGDQSIALILCRVASKWCRQSYMWSNDLNFVAKAEDDVASAFNRHNSTTPVVVPTNRTFPYTFEKDMQRTLCWDKDNAFEVCSSTIGAVLDGEAADDKSFGINVGTTTMFKAP